ncbi:hypothetical protein F4805DRAFT_435723 [Annulohypoxylon moriforme]|nr:hypothetical protein F4805DRAFT_435723 [Annulohypoxylon moriforme]
MTNITQYKSSPVLGTITITRRDDLSLLYRILRMVIKPLRPRLVAPKGEHPAGSPRLRKRPHHIRRVIIEEREVLIPSNPPSDAEISPRINVESLWVYDFHPAESGNGTNRPRHTVFYFPGGGFQAPASSEHWKFCAHLASSLPQSRITLVSYPLAPHSPAKVTLPFLRKWVA